MVLIVPGTLHDKLHIVSYGVNPKDCTDTKFVEIDSIFSKIRPRITVRKSLGRIVFAYTIFTSFIFVNDYIDCTVSVKLQRPVSIL